MKGSSNHPYYEIWILALIFIISAAFLAGTGNALYAQSAPPVVTDVVISRNSAGVPQAVVTGMNFPSSGVVVEINGIPAARTRVLRSNSLPDGTPTRLRVRDSRLEEIINSGDQVVFHVLDSNSGQRSEAFLLDPRAPRQLRLTKFAQLGGIPDIYHMTEAPDGSYFVTQYRSSSLVRLSRSGSIIETQRGSFIFPSAVVFLDQDVGYTACNPAPFASRGFCLSNSPNCRRGENVPPGNINGVSNPRYALGADEGLTSRTFFISNGGTGEIRLIDPVSRTNRTITGGFTRATTDPNSRGPEQIAYNRRERRLFVPDSGKGTLVSIDEVSGSQTVLRSGLNYPFGLALLPGGNLLLSNRGDGSIMEITQQGELVNRFESGMGADSLRGLTVNSRGEIFLLADSIQTIFRLELN
jgi:hypothetical protein